MDIDPAHLKKIKAVFPDLEISAVRVNRDGLINDVLIVNEEFVFRFLRNSDWGVKLFTNSR